MTSSSDSPLPTTQVLSRRERQVMDVLFERGPSTVAEVLAALPDPPSYSAIRALLRTMESKRYVRHERDGMRYVYAPLAERESESRLALRHLVRTFFGGSARSVVEALVNDNEALAKEELEALSRLIASAKAEGR